MKCITKKALCVLLSALLTVSVFATCLIFSASAADEIKIDNFGKYAGGTSTIMTRIGDLKTIGEVRASLNNGTVNDYNYFYAIVCDNTGKIISTNTTLGRPDGVKTNMEIPEGGFILLCNAEAPNADSYKNAKVGEYVTLNNVDLKALAEAKVATDLSNASFTMSAEAPATSEDPSEDPSENKNLALGATVVTAPSYQDRYNGKINDGIIGVYGEYDNHDWAGFYYTTNEDYAQDVNYDGNLGEIILDFGKTIDFTSFRTHIWGTECSGIVEVAQVEFFVSNDNSTWTSVGVDADDLTGEGAWAELEATASGRYVKYAYTPKKANAIFLFVSECEAYGKEAAEEPSEESSEEPVDPVDPNAPVIAKPANSAFTLNVNAPASVKAGEAFNVVISISDLETALYGVEATLTYDKNLFTATNTSDLLALLKAKNSESGEWESLSIATDGKYELSYATAEATNRITDAKELVITVPFVAKKDVKSTEAYFVVDAVAGTDEDTERVDGTGSYAKVATVEAGTPVQPGKPSIKDVADPAAKVVITLDGELKAGNTVTATITLKDLKSAILGLDFTLSYDAAALVPVLPNDLIDTLTKAPFVTDPAWESLTTTENGKINFSFVNAQDANAVKNGDEIEVTVKFLVSEAVADGYTAYIVADDVAVTDINAERVDALGAVAELTSDKTEEPSSEPSSEEPSSDPSEDSSEESNTSPATGDLGVAAIALLALVTAGGVFAVRKFR